MTNVITPFQFLAIALAGWLNRQQQMVIDYLIEENRALKDQLDGQRLRFTDERVPGEFELKPQWVADKVPSCGFANGTYPT